MRLGWCWCKTQGFGNGALHFWFLGRLKRPSWVGCHDAGGNGGGGTTARVGGYMLRNDPVVRLRKDVGKGLAWDT